jgi:hypothetical protein
MRTLCPDEERISDYLEGRLNDNDRADIEEHLSGCETCRQEFIIGKGLVRGGGLETDPVPEEVTQSALRILIRRGLIPGRPFNERCAQFLSEMCSRLDYLIRQILWGRWGLATIRGPRRVISEDLVHIKKRFIDLEADIEIEKAGDSMAHIRVKLEGSNSAKEAVRVTLQRGKREVSSCLTDKRGHVLFEDMPFGSYNLIFKRDNKALGNYHFKIKEK